MFGVQKLKFQAILEKIFVIDDKTHLHVVCVCVCMRSKLFRVFIDFVF